MIITNIILGLILISLLVLIGLVYQLTFLLDAEIKRESIRRTEGVLIGFFTSVFILFILFAVIVLIAWKTTPLTWSQWINIWF